MTTIHPEHSNLFSEARRISRERRGRRITFFLPGMFTLDGVRVHVSHGHEIGRKATPESRAAAYAGADVVIYGHTHIQRIDQVGRQLVVNPGYNRDRGPADFLGLLLHAEI